MVGPNSPALELERTITGEYMWRFRAGNGERVSWSGETYADRADCIAGAELGSPCFNVVSAIQNDLNEVDCHYKGAFTVARLRRINNYDSVPGDGQVAATDEGLTLYQHSLRRTPEARDIIGDHVLNSPALSFMMEAGFSMEDGHVTMMTETWHVKDPENDVCRILNCGMQMIEPTP